MERFDNNNSKNINILIVDDDEGDILCIKRALTKCKLNNPVYVANNGLEALELLRNESKTIWPVLILLDINMPKMNGLEFLKVLRNDPKLKRAIVMVLSTSDEQSDIGEAYDFNVAGYLLKQEVLDNFMTLVNLVDDFSLTIKYPDTSYST